MQDKDYTDTKEKQLVYKTSINQVYFMSGAIEKKKPRRIWMEIRK